MLFFPPDPSFFALNGLFRPFDRAWPVFQNGGGAFGGYNFFSPSYRNNLFNPPFSDLLDRSFEPLLCFPSPKWIGDMGLFSGGVA